MLQDWINGFLGVWLILLATFGLASNTMVFIAGIAIAVLGFWGVMRSRDAEDEASYRRDLGLYSE
jgi:hypothetical protein